MDKEKNTKAPAPSRRRTSSAPEPKPSGSRHKTRDGSGYLRQLYSTARSTAGSTHSHLKSQTTLLVNFIPTEKVDASELQVRTHFDDEEIEGLSNSIKAHGVLQPILVVQDGDRYKVIAGERRLRASKEAGMDRIPARVITTDDKATHEIALRENLDRVDLHPIEEGEGYLSLLESKAYSSHDTIAKAFSKKKSRVTEYVGFTRLPETTKEALLSTGVKNRAVLRQLMNSAPEEHLEIIKKVAGKEDDLIGGKLEQLTAVQAKKPPAPKKPAESFTFNLDKKGLKVPGFKWKKGEGKEKLQQYAGELKKLMRSVEKELNQLK